MIYTKNTNKALRLCFDKHKEQVDKSGIPYVFHPFHLAEQMTDENSTIVALLHDVVEDTDTTFEDLEKLGFSDEVLDALRLLTHDDEVPYMDYVARIKENAIAKAVKMADLNHNMDLSRFETEPTERDLLRREKYIKALDFLAN